MASSNNRNRSNKISAIAPSGTFTKYSDNVRTQEGGLAPLISDEQMLRRTTLANYLWEGGFYENGVDIGDRIVQLIPNVDPQVVFDIAVEAREKMKLRHVPLLLATEMLKYPEHKKLVRKLVRRIIQRTDELPEILSVYWRKELLPVRSKEGVFVSQRKASDRKIPMQLKRGIRDAFEKFDQYQMLKWQSKGSPVTLADVIRLCHPDPTLATRQSQNIDMPMKDVYAAIIAGTALAPDTWESRLSAAGKEAKKDIFTDMLVKNELGSLALISNLRGMLEAGVDIDLIRAALARMNIERVLPYRFITAARYAPSLKPELQTAMFRCVENIDKLPGKTVLLVDISGSMSYPMSRRPDGRGSDLKRIDGAAALCILAQSICDETSIYLFNTATYKVNDTSIDSVNKASRDTSLYYAGSTGGRTFSSPLTGFNLSEAISNSIMGGTDMAQAVAYINRNEQYDRFIVFSDDESATRPENPKALGFSINVASSNHGVAYEDWCKITGFSENVLVYITEYEKHLRESVNG